MNEQKGGKALTGQRKRKKGLSPLSSASMAGWLPKEGCLGLEVWGAAACGVYHGNTNSGM